MKSLIIAFILSFNLIHSVVITHNENSNSYSENMVNKINSMTTTWKAGNTGMTKEQLKLVVGEPFDIKKIKEGKPIKHVIPRDNLPENFDWREQMPNCKSIMDVTDQGSCGSCWAFAAAESLSDRFCIKSKGELQPFISVTHLVSCCKYCGWYLGGCYGGLPYFAFDYMKNSGSCTGSPYNTTGSCKPYIFEPCEHHGIPGPLPPCDNSKRFEPECKEECDAGYDKKLEDDLYYVEDAYFLGQDVNEVMTEIYENGPITAVFSVYEDIAFYKEGVYEYTTGEFVGLHCVKVIGWGIENGVEYWLATNSWNRNFGMNGFFKFVRGKNHLDFELLMAAGTPKIMPKN